MDAFVESSPVVSSDHAVWVQNGNELEHEHAAQRVRTGVVSPQNEVEETVEHERGRRFSGVHAAAEEKHLQEQTTRSGWAPHPLQEHVRPELWRSNQS